MTTNATPRDSTPRPAVTSADLNARRLLAILFCATIVLSAILIVLYRLESHVALQTLCVVLIVMGGTWQFHLVTKTDALPGLRNWYMRDPARADQFIRWGFVAPAMLIAGFFLVTGRWLSSSAGIYVILFWMFWGIDLLYRVVPARWLRQRIDYRKQRVRRRLVIALCAVLLLPLICLPILYILQPESDKWPTAFLDILFAPVFLGMSGVSAMSRFLNEERMTGREADERQISVRDRAYRLAYRLLGATLVLLFLALCLGLLLHLHIPHFGLADTMWAFFIVILFVSVLPNAMILWIEEDLPDEADQASLSALAEPAL